MPPADLQSMLEELQASRRRLEGMALSSRAANRIGRVLERLASRLSRPPRVVLLGEFNAGKTTLANALIGSDLLPTSIHANTRIPIHVRYGKVSSVALELRDHTRRPLSEATLPLLAVGGARMLHVALPVERLRTFELIDTPGLASGLAGLDAANAEACRQANVAIWCTASTQAWKATERAAWIAVPPRLHRKGLLVSTLADALNTDRDRSRVEARLRAEAGRYFAEIAMVTAAEVDELRRDPSVPEFDERWIASGGAALDAAIERLLQEVWAERALAAGRVLARVAAHVDEKPAGRTAAA